VIVSSLSYFKVIFKVFLKSFLSLMKLNFASKFKRHENNEVNFRKLKFVFCFEKCHLERFLRETQLQKDQSKVEDQKD